MPQRRTAVDDASRAGPEFCLRVSGGDGGRTLTARSFHYRHASGLRFAAPRPPRRRAWLPQCCPERSRACAQHFRDEDCFGLGSPGRTGKRGERASLFTERKSGTPTGVSVTLSAALRAPRTISPLPEVQSIHSRVPHPHSLAGLEVCCTDRDRPAERIDNDVTRRFGRQPYPPLDDDFPLSRICCPREGAGGGGEQERGGMPRTANERKGRCKA